VLYDYWVRMYKKRNGHSGIAPMTA
jgi:hypothetical protein